MTRLFKIHFILALLLSVQTSISKEIGVASAVNKNTTDLTLEEERKLVEAGYKIIQNHTLETDAIGRAALLLVDGTSFSIGPNSSVTLDKFIYNPETAEGSLEVSSRGLLRLVGGKVTKKRPALIRTNSATVGIRGGITIVQTQGLSTSAAFVYGEELTMTPNQNSAAATSLIENGFVVTVEDPTDEVSEPQQLSETFLAELQKGLEARENDEESSEEESSEEESSEEESSEEESSEEESSEEESTEESKEEESTEESTQEESSEEQSEESSEDTTTEEGASEEQSESTTEDNTSEDQGQDNDTQEESASATEPESGSDNSAAQEDSASDSNLETQTSDQADTSTEVDNDPQPDVDESALDSSGVSDNSSDIAPSELSTADDVVDTAFDVDTTSDEVEETTEETEEASEASIEDTAAVETTETVVEEAPFDASLSNASIQINENETDINLATLQTNKDDDVEVTVTIDGEDKDLFQYDPSTNSLSFIGEANYEDKANFSLNLIVQREGEEVVIPVNISVRDINEAPSVSTEIQDSYAEDLSTGSVLVGVTVSDPENQEVTYSITGEGSDKFTINEAGNITLAESFDFEAKASYTLTVIATDGELSSETEVLINVGDINEAPSLSSALSSTSFSEDSALGTIIATSSVSDPESNVITYSLTGTGSEYFSVDENGNVTLKDTLDFETYTNYEITLVASDGELTSSSVIIFDISDVDEAPSLSSTLKSESFEESIAVGTALATISSIDPESQTVTYSLSGTGSEKFEIDNEGNITSKATFDYETATSYTFNVTASDGTNSTTSPLTITLSDVNESPDVTISLQGSEFAENIATGTTIATVAYTDPESDTLSYTLSGTGSDQFSVDDQGIITLKTGLDYETKTSYELTLTSSDGANSVQTQISFSVTDISELALSLDNTEVTLAENISTGSSVAIASSSDAAGEVTYSIAEGTAGSSIFAIDSQGKITLESSLDFETKTSYTLEVSVTDGKETVTRQLVVTVSDVDLTLSSSLASSSQSETISTGTTILTSSTSNSEGTVSYSLTDDDNKFSIDSSTGEVTLSNALDYETKTSHSFTVSATDGVTTTSQTFTLTVDNVAINTLAVTLANSGAALAESSSSGTTVGSSSISNPESETVSYSLSGTGSSNFAVDSSGNITTNAALDYETAKSYSLTLNAAAGGTTTTDAFTVNVKNVEELQSAVLRYSAAYNSVSRSGFSATATRGPSGSSLPAYTLEQVGTTNSTDITSVDDTSLNYVPVEINSGTVLNWRYYFPIDTSGNGEFSFAPNSSALDGKYYSTLGTAVTTTIANADFLTAGRLEGAKYWFMTTDKAGAQISYNSSSGNIGDLLITDHYDGATNYERYWTEANSAATNPLTATYEDGLKDYTFSDLSGYAVVVDGANDRFGNDDTNYAGNRSAALSFIQQENKVLIFTGENSGWRLKNDSIVTFLETIMSGSDFSWSSGGMSTVNFTYSGFSFSSSASSLNDSQLNCPSGFDTYCFGSFAFFPASMTDSEYKSDVFVWLTLNQQQGSTLDTQIINYANTILGSPTTSTYNLYEDQVTIAGEVYTDALFKTHTDSYALNKRVYGFLVLPIENFAASGTSNDYFYPNFIPTTLWSYGDVGHDYCLGMASNSASDCNTYENYYDFSNIALSEAVNSGSERIDTSRFTGGVSDLPEGQSMWWQVLDTSGNFNKGVGLWAQISFKDSYTGWAGVATHDDQESLLNVVISSIDDRKNDTTRYSAGDTGLGMDGYHYWSYQGATNADNDGLGINYGTSPIECATSSDTGCFWGTDSAETFRGAMITSSDPYKSGDMTLSVNYNSNNDTFSTGTFNQSIVQVDAKPASLSGYYVSLQAQNFRSVNFYRSSATGYSGFFNGILEFDVSGTGNSQLSSIRSSSTLASFTFDATNDDLQVVAPMTVSAAPSNNYTSNWTTVDTGSITLKFGDATNDEAKSAYISHEVFGAEIQDDGTQIDGTSGGSNNLAGVMVSYNTLDEKDSDLFQSSNFLDMPDTDYSTWGFWAMSAADISPNSGDQNASVHLGTWVGGELVDQNEIPTSGSASMTGSAAVNVAYRYNQTGTNYDVHKYTTAADVAASFSWGTSGYSGTLNFTNYDHKNPIIANAGFSGFVVAITGTNNTYAGNSTTSLQNDWLGGAAVAGALFGDSSPTESGGRVNVNLYKSGDTATAGANDFYMAEGIYLLCENGGC